MPASRRRGMRMPPDQSTRTNQQRQFPHINAISGESRRFCKKTFNASSRSTVRGASRRVGDAVTCAGEALRADLPTPRRSLSSLSATPEPKSGRSRDEHELRTTAFDSAETAAAQRFSRLRLLSADGTSGKSGAAEFSRRRPCRARSRRLGGAGSRSSGAGEDAHRRPSPLRSAVAGRGDGEARRSGAQMVAAVVSRRHGEGRRDDRGAVAGAARRVVRRCRGGTLARARLQRVWGAAAQGQSRPLRTVRRHSAARYRRHHCARSNMPSTCSKPTASAY